MRSIRSGRDRHTGAGQPWAHTWGIYSGSTGSVTDVTVELARLARAPEQPLPTNNLSPPVERAATRSSSEMSLRSLAQLVVGVVIDRRSRYPRVAPITEDTSPWRVPRRQAVLALRSA